MRENAIHEAEEEELSGWYKAPGSVDLSQILGTATSVQTNFTMSYPTGSNEKQEPVSTGYVSADLLDSDVDTDGSLIKALVAEGKASI